MKFKPRPDIPTPILKALMGDRYEQDLQEHMEDLPDGIKNRFSHTISVTTLARSARQRLLFIRHADDIEIDPEDRAHALLGRVIHTILMENREPHQIAEERLGFVYPLKVTWPAPKGYPKRLDVYVHGAADLYDPHTEEIWDYKTPKTGSLMYDKSDYVAQLNILAYIWRMRGRKVTKLRNAYLLIKDYDKRMVKDDNDYPKTRFPSPEVPVWSDEDCQDYLLKRLTAHFSNEGKKDDEIDFCTDAERWQSPAQFPVYKVGAEKMAKHWASSKIEAEDKIAELEEEDWAKLVAKNNELKKPKPEDQLKRASFFFKEKPSAPRRCAHCESFAWCSQRRNELIEQAQLTENNEPDDLP